MTKSWSINNDYGNTTKVLTQNESGFYIKELDQRGVVINTLKLSEEEIMKLHASMRKIDEY